MLGPTERKPFEPVLSIFAVGRGDDDDFHRVEARSDAAVAELDAGEAGGHLQHHSTSFAMNSGFPVHVKGMEQWRNGVYLAHRKPWRGDQVKMRTFDWINDNRHECGIRHLEYDPWVRSSAMSGDTLAIASDIDTVKPPRGLGSEPQAFSEGALQQ